MKISNEGLKYIPVPSTHATIVTFEPCNNGSKVITCNNCMRRGRACDEASGTNLDLLPANINLAQVEVHPNGSLHVCHVRTLAEPPDEARLADSVVSDQDDLEYVVISDL